MSVKCNIYTACMKYPQDLQELQALHGGRGGSGRDMAHDASLMSSGPTIQSF